MLLTRMRSYQNQIIPTKLQNDFAYSTRRKKLSTFCSLTKKHKSIGGQKEAKLQSGGKCSLCIMIVLFSQRFETSTFLEKSLRKTCEFATFSITSSMKFFSSFQQKLLFITQQSSKIVPGPSLLTNRIMFSIIARL